MSLDIYLEKKMPKTVFQRNITHNLTGMADEAGIYEALWRPEDKGFKKAKDVIPSLKKGLKRLKESPDYYKIFNPENGWGSYEGLVEFVRAYRDACEANPDADVTVSR